MVEPYAENVVRVSISLMKERAAAAAGYGISAKPEAGGWTKESGAGGDVLRSARMSVTVAPQGGKYTQTGTQADIAKFFGGSTPGVGISIKNDQERGWPAAGADARMGDVRAKLQGWQCGHLE